jgi:hypothetical protein
MIANFCYKNPFLKRLPMPTEVWYDVLLFLNRRYDMPRSFSLVNRRFHALAYPLMHEHYSHDVILMYIRPDDQDPEKFESFNSFGHILP